jgi:hypothetical protein
MHTPDPGWRAQSLSCARGGAGGDAHRGRVPVCGDGAGGSGGQFRHFLWFNGTAASSIDAILIPGLNLYPFTAFCTRQYCLKLSQFLALQIR